MTFYTHAGQFTTYDNIAVQGMGVPAIVYASQDSNVTTGISVDVTTATGLYLITIYYGIYAGNLGGGTIQSTVTYYQPGSTSHTLTGTLITAGNAGLNYSVSYVVFHIGANALHVTVTSTCTGLNGTLDRSVAVTRLQ